MISPRRAVDSPLAVVVGISAVLTLITQWVLHMPQAGLDTAFGFQLPVVWLIVISFAVVLVATNLTLGLAAVLAGEAVVIGWFVWATWLVTTSRFAVFDFPFMGIDLIGQGWFIAAIGLMATGAIIARRFRDLQPKPGAEVWLLSLLPGIGLIRLDRTTRGAIYAGVVLLTILLASIDSQVALLFLPVAGTFEPPPPPNRALEWIFLSTAGVLAVLSVIDTVRAKEKLARS